MNTQDKISLVLLILMLAIIALTATRMPEIDEKLAPGEKVIRSHAEQIYKDL